MKYSPVLSIITALFELLVIVWALSKGKRNKIVYTSCTILLLLALYQILEILVCYSELNSIVFARMGFLVITWLPVFGLLLICFLFPYRSKTLLRFVQLMLFSAFLLNLWIMLDHNFLSGSVCSIVFAQYSNPMPGFLIFGVFYQLGLFGMITTSAIGIIKSSDPKNRLKLGQVMFGSMAFVFSSMMFTIAFQPARGTLTSVLCHFSLLLAVFLTRLIYLENRSEV